MSILVIAATPLEARQLPDALICGLGLVNTAHALTRRFVEHGVPSLVVQTGVAGAFAQANVPVGSVVIATEEIYADAGVLAPDGWTGLDAIGIPLIPAAEGGSAVFNVLPLDADLVSRAMRIARPDVAAAGRFLTLSQVTGLREAADVLYERWSGLCESMEGAAAAHVCALYGVAFLEVRGISNLLVDRDRASWRIEEAATAAQGVVAKLLSQHEQLLSDISPSRPRHDDTKMASGLAFDTGEP
jgi:futalosine hydrolase